MNICSRRIGNQYPSPGTSSLVLKVSEHVKTSSWLCSTHLGAQGLIKIGQNTSKSVEGWYVYMFQAPAHPVISPLLIKEIFRKSKKLKKFLAKLSVEPVGPKCPAPGSQRLVEELSGDFL